MVTKDELQAQLAHAQKAKDQALSQVLEMSGQVSDLTSRLKSLETRFIKQESPAAMHNLDIVQHRYCSSTYM